MTNKQVLSKNVFLLQILSSFKRRSKASVFLINLNLRSPDSRQIGVSFDDGIVRIVQVDASGDGDATLAVVQMHSTHKEIAKEVSLLFSLRSIFTGLLKCPFFV